MRENNIERDADAFVETVAANIRAFRASAKLTLSDLEGRLSEMGVPIGRATLSRIERGERRPDIWQLYAIAEAFDSAVWCLIQEPWPTEGFSSKNLDEAKRKANRQLLDDVEGALEIYVKGEQCAEDDCYQSATCGSVANHPRDGGVLMVAVCSQHNPPSADAWGNATHVMGYRMPS